jgi:hypothetical protein
MSVKLDRENQVMVFTFEGIVTESDIKLAVTETAKVCDSSLNPVNFIVDAAGIKRFPPNILLMLKTEVAPHYHSNIGTVIVITRNVVIARTVMFLCHLLPIVAIQMVHTHDEAWAQINRLTHAPT